MPTTFGLPGKLIWPGLTPISVMPGGTTIERLAADETTVGVSPALVASTSS